ncbi:MAG: tetratricopeptide repeat protein, partial [Candidatus Eremiobacterota bacterium]
YIAVIIISLLLLTSCETVKNNREDESSVSIKPVGTAKEITETAEYIKKGIDLYKEKKFREAIAYYDDMIKLHPKDSELLIYKGAALAAINHYSEALTCYDKALELNPHSGKTWHYRGLALMQLNKTGEGIKSLQKAIEIDPSYMSARNELSLKPSDVKVNPTEVPAPLLPATPAYPPGSGIITRVEKK